MDHVEKQAAAVVARAQAGRLSRRGLLKAAGAAGAALAVPTAVANASGGSRISFPSSNRQDATPKSGGVLIYGLSTDPSNFEPQVSSGGASGNLKLMVYNALLKYDASGQLVGDLAETFGFVDDVTYEMKIREGVTFHDGSALTVDDVIFSIQRIQNPETAASNAQRFSRVASVEAGDGNVVRLKLSKTDPTLPYVLADNNSMIVSKAWIESGVDPKTTMNGTGPFKFVERQPGIVVRLVKNENYFEEGKPYLDGIDYQPMPDDNARVTALRSGSIDFMDYVPYTQMDTIAGDSNLVFQSDDQLGFGWVGWNHEMDVVKDVKVRQAFAYGMDREKMVQIAFAGHGSPITGGFIPEGWIGHSPDLDGTFNADYDKAKSLLTEAGYDKVELPMVSTSTYSVIQRPAEAAQAELQEANIDLKLELQEWLTFRDTVQAGTFPVHGWGTALSYNDPDALSPFIESTGSFAKQFRFSDPQIDELMEQGRSTLDVDSRNQIYHDVEKRVLEVLPWTYTIRRVQGEAHQTFVKGYVHLGTGGWTQVTLRDAWLDK
jgi:peptide/nickel transport system substrate-binding protein